MRVSYTTIRSAMQSSRKMVVYVRRLFMNAVRENTLTFCDDGDIDRLRKEDKWIKRCLGAALGDVHRAIVCLVFMFKWRTVNGVHKAFEGRFLDDYKKLICEHGKDKKGNPLLVINITEITKLSVLGFDPSCIGELLIKWFEELDSRKEVTNISVVFYHGDNKHMENLDDFLNLVLDVSGGYVDFLDTVYVFEDVLSYNVRRLLNMSNLLRRVPVKYVNQKNCKELINLDLPAYERENNLPDTKVKNEDPVQPKSETTSESINCKGMRKPKDENNKIKNNVQDEVAKAESKEVAETVREENDKDTKEVAKRVLKKLHELQLEMNVLIKDVMNLL